MKQLVNAAIFRAICNVLFGEILYKGGTAVHIIHQTS
jgi:hypothetical protein